MSQLSDGQQCGEDFDENVSYGGGGRVGVVELDRVRGGGGELQAASHLQHCLVLQTFAYHGVKVVGGQVVDLEIQLTNHVRALCVVC